MDPKILLAQAEKELGTLGGPPDEGFGPWGLLGKESNVSKAVDYFNNIVSRILGIMTIIAGLWFLLHLINGGYNYMNAKGDPQKINEANKKITSAFIGLIIVIATYAVISLLGNILGFKILQPQEIIPFLGPER